MKNLFLTILLTLSFAPISAFAAPDCETYPDKTECICFLDTGGAPATSSDLDISSTSTDDVDCQQHCDDLNAVSYQFNECVDGVAKLGDNTSLANSGVYTAPTDSTVSASEQGTPVIPILNVPIPGLDLAGSVTIGNGTVKSNLLGLYIKAVYSFLLVVGSLVAVVMLMVGGLQYTVSGGSSKRVEQAKQRMSKAIIGLVLLFAAYDLAFLLDPNTVSFKSLVVESVPQIASDERAAFMLDAAGVSSSGGTTLDSFKNSACPTSTELTAGTTFYITSYYSPAYGDTGYGGISFECNIAMQCACPNGGGRKNAPTAAKTCYSKGLNYSWEPCTSFPSTTTFCDKTTAYKQGLVTTPPQAHYTAAVSPCLPMGTVFKVFGAPDSASNSAVWHAEDTGGEIKGKRVDLYLGQGQSAYQTALKNYGEVTIRTCPGNDVSKCPTSIN